MNRVLLSLSLAALGLLGCTTEVMLDGGMEPPTGPPRTLTLISEASLALPFGELSRVTVELSEEGEPVPNEIVRLAFFGNGQDSSLTETELVTGPDGRISTDLVAGSSVAFFRVRASAERADPVFVEVSVSNEGFGVLEVTAPYDGEREYMQRVVHVYSDVTCDEELPRNPARAGVLDEDDDLVAEFRTLPAGLSYTVVGRVEGPTGAPLATSCRDGVEVMADMTTEVVLSFDDTPLVPEGVYDVEVMVEAMFFEPALQAGLDATSGITSEMAASRYLDALERELMMRGETAALTSFQTARASGMVEASLATRLDMASAGPAVALATFFADLSARLESIRVSGPLDVRTVDDELRSSWRVESLVLAPMPAPDTPTPLNLDLTLLSLEPQLTVRWDGEALRLEPVRLSLRVGTLVDSAMQAATVAAAGDGAAVREDAGCDELARWVGESPILSPACDASCAEASCLAVMSEVYRSAAAAILSVDYGRETMQLSGDAEVYDEDADLLIDRIDATLEGAWSGAMIMPGDEVTGTLRATRVPSTDG